jgi:tRNA-dihydrouridine synthase B
MLKIGPYTLDNSVVLAPMAGVTDLPFRQLCRRLGAGMAVTEMVSSNSLLWGSEKTRRRACHDGETDPISVQIMGTDPRMMAEAARFNAGEGAQIIDINMGCPAKKVCNVLAGSALLRDESLVGQILHAVVDAVDVPVTLKIRTGWSPEQRNGVAIARIAEQSGIQSLAVHGRTRACGYKQNTVEYDTMAAIKQAINIPLLANGDINTPEKAREVLDYTQADGVMIGRAAQGRPWIFREINHFLQHGTHLPEPELTEIRALLLQHLDALYAFYGEYKGTRVARKHIAWYSKGQRDGSQFRQRIMKVDSASEQLTQVRQYFDQLIDSASSSTNPLAA